MCIGEKIAEMRKQNNMTQNIQNAISQTSERSRKMVDIATESNASIKENMKVMEELQVQSKQIAATNAQVSESMMRLRDKTKEVEEIASVAETAPATDEQAEATKTEEEQTQEEN